MRSEEEGDRGAGGRPENRDDQRDQIQRELTNFEERFCERYCYPDPDVEGCKITNFRITRTRPQELWVAATVYCIQETYQDANSYGRTRGYNKLTTVRFTRFASTWQLDLALQ